MSNRYVRSIGGEVTPFSFKELRQENPNVSFPAEVDDAFLADYGIHPLVDERPSITAGQTVTAGPIEKVDGVWTQTYTVGRSDIEVIRELINDERDRRTDAGFDYIVRGTTYHFQSDPKSLANITGAAALGGFAAMSGSPVGYYGWSTNGVSDFVFSTADNIDVKMDAAEAFKFGQVAANHVSRHIFKAKALKRMDPIPEDYTDDKYW